MKKKWRHGWRIKTLTDKNFVLVSSRMCILPDVCKNWKLSFCKKNGATDGAQRKQTTRTLFLSAHGRALLVNSGNIQPPRPFAIVTVATTAAFFRVKVSGPKAAPL